MHKQYIITSFITFLKFLKKKILDFFILIAIWSGFNFIEWSYLFEKLDLDLVKYFILIIFIAKIELFFAFIFKKSSYNIVEKKYDNVNKDKNYYTVIGKKYERIYPMQINDSENPSGGLYYYLFLITKVLTITFWLLFVIHVVFFIYDQSMYISMWKNTFNILKNLLITENCIELYIELYREFYAILYVFVLVSIIEVIISLMVKGFARSFNVIVKWCKNL